MAVLTFLNFAFPFLKYLLIFGCPSSQLLHAGFLQLQRAAASLYLQCTSCSLCQLLLSNTDCRCSGFSSCCCGLTADSSQAPEHKPSCDAWPQLPCNMWDPPRPGMELASPMLQSRYLTSGPPGKFLLQLFWRSLTSHFLSVDDNRSLLAMNNWAIRHGFPQLH